MRDGEQMLRRKRTLHIIVMAGLVPAIHVSVSPPPCVWLHCRGTGSIDKFDIIWY